MSLRNNTALTTEDYEYVGMRAVISNWESKTAARAFVVKSRNANLEIEVKSVTCLGNCEIKEKREIDSTNKTI